MGTSNGPKPWTEAHKREALRRTYEIAAELNDDPHRADGIATDAVYFSGACGRWRAHLKTSGLVLARIEREVRRVRALAEGRLVRETVWYARSRLGDVSDERPDRSVLLADLKAAGRTRIANGDRIVRVTRVRRAP